jgi:hypothetical protein
MIYEENYKFYFKYYNLISDKTNCFKKKKIILNIKKKKNSNSINKIFCIKN